MTSSVPTLPGYKHNRPGLLRYKRMYVLTERGPNRVSASLYLLHLTRCLPDIGERKISIHLECVTQLAHRLYPLYMGAVSYSRKDFVAKVLSEVDTLMRLGVSLKRKPNRRMIKELKLLFPYVDVSELKVSRGGKRYIVKVLLP